jgi:hypothetical protein
VNVNLLNIQGPGLAGYDDVDFFGLGATTTSPTPVTWTIPSWYWIITAASSGASAYHGYKRSGGDMAVTIGWALLGAIFPIITPAVALAQGFGERG